MDNISKLFDNTTKIINTVNPDFSFLGIEIFSSAFGDLSLVSFDEDTITLSTKDEKLIYQFDNYGRLADTGEPLLFPKRNTKAWYYFYKTYIRFYLYLILKPDTPCLYYEEGNNWRLAVLKELPELEELLGKLGGTDLFRIQRNDGGYVRIDKVLPFSLKYFNKTSFPIWYETWEFNFNKELFEL